MGKHFHDVSRHCPVTGCWAPPGRPCLNLVTEKPMYDEVGPVVHPARVEPYRDPRGPEGGERHGDA